jgi:hypothetical protein
MFREHTHKAADGDRPAGSALPKILAVVAVIGILRMLSNHRPGRGDASSWRERRRQMIAELHRELHREEVGASAEETAKA